MKICRFVDREGWQKWEFVQMPLPRVWVMAPSHAVPRVLPTLNSGPTTVRPRHFHLQEWCVPSWLNEHVYSEDDQTIDRELFQEQSPSMHRERQMAECLRTIGSLVRDAGAARSPFVELLSARTAIERIHEVIRRFESTFEQRVMPL
jgi:hypothetical protein